MKRSLLFIIFGATLLWSATSHALGDGTLGFGSGANSNPHNLSAVAGNTNPKKALAQATPGKETQICIFCHTPHGATPLSTLWGRPDPDGMGSFQTLTDPALGISDSTVIGSSLYDSASGNYPNGTSKLCLSCHDGVTAMGILANGDEIAMTADLATEVVLTTSHPISFVYNQTVVNLLVAPPLSKSLKYPDQPADYLDGSYRVQCTSCHQPHQDTRGTGGTYPFWRVGSGTSTDYDTVCNACHTGSTSSGGTGHTGYP